MDAAQVLQELMAVNAGLAVCWLGNDGWLLRGQGRLIAFDLDLDPASRLAPAPVSAEDLAPVLEALFISHEHGDHFNDRTAAVLAERSRCLFVLPANCVEKARSLKIPESRIVVARPRQAMEVLGISVRPQRAFHGHVHQSVHRNANLEDCGYLLTMAGLSILQPGDSILTQDQLELKGVDVLFVSPTDHNMHIAPAVKLISTLRPKWIFPQHFQTYRVTPQNSFWTIGYPDEMAATLPADLQQNYHKLGQGEVLAIGGK